MPWPRRTSPAGAPLYPSQSTVAELKKKFHGLKKTYYPARQRFALPVKAGETRGQVLSDDSKRLSDYGLAEGGKLEFKDLGPQV